ncbi:MAG: 30S ribosomal protein S18 [Candidatus Pacebacteria bacterium]|jgi:small subunit ribosomal protein S18|nr:30S ribosomal protein S18 [Candidatus Paceibacterota bacterium]
MFKLNNKSKMKKNTQCYFTTNNVKLIDYKDVDILKKFLTPHARMIAGKRTGVSAKYQRQLAQAIKRARFMALLPFVAK